MGWTSCTILRNSTCRISPECRWSTRSYLGRPHTRVVFRWTLQRYKSSATIVVRCFLRVGGSRKGAFLFLNNHSWFAIDFESYPFTQMCPLHSVLFQVGGPLRCIDSERKRTAKIVLVHCDSLTYLC